jgi:radical SAM protein with 4Fe4S-binding SPASM domain
MTRAHAKEIATLGLVAVEMSLYGAKCDVHDTITRRPGSHRKTIRAALMLRRLGVPVVLKSPVFAGTAGGHRDFMKLAERVGAHGKLDPSIMIRRNGDPAPTHLRSSANELAVVLRDLLDIKPGDPLPPPADPDSAPCAIGRRTARIGPEGNVYPCSTYPTHVGNLNETSFAKIWFGDSPLLARLRAVKFSDFGPTCTGCAKSGYCSRCLAMAVIEHGDERAPVAQACRIAEGREIAAGVVDAMPAPGLVAARERNAGRRSLPLVG